MSWKCSQRLTESFGCNRNFSSAIQCSEYSEGEKKKVVFLFKKCLIIWGKHILPGVCDSGALIIKRMLFSGHHRGLKLDVKVRNDPKN